VVEDLTLRWKGSVLEGKTSSGLGVSTKGLAAGPKWRYGPTIRDDAPFHPRIFFSQPLSQLVPSLSEIWFPTHIDRKKQFIA
jgi:hypothetical protein